MPIWKRGIRKGRISMPFKSMFIGIFTGMLKPMFSSGISGM
ncbi:hypothetical protein LAUMK4_05805 [Mycobacterium persicum]|uniref:Uncharacterized protein n=1 Tax=Mycobacterium persicum TaxID=1487726 RepID=A0AB38V2K1_9MYCO|nr:hypothetical protein LAUMK15_05671 [Mycobacterium persicum]VAZ86725.1 hypothetical protein LAUMK42_05578 [Mycobacterium persicum]VBA32773.1 hypothetical protein LAUMK4_05805 [Mycobacterium persicum]